MNRMEKSSEQRVDRFFSIGEDIILIFIGLCLFITALFLLYGIIESFINLLKGEELIKCVVNTLDKILLVLMIIEILYTVKVSFKAHALLAEPFLLIGLIAAVRRILVISVEAVYLPNITHGSSLIIWLKYPYWVC